MKGIIMAIWCAYYYVHENLVENFWEIFFIHPFFFISVLTALLCIFFGLLTITHIFIAHKQDDNLLPAYSLMSDNKKKIYKTTGTLKEKKDKQKSIKRFPFEW